MHHLTQLFTHLGAHQPEKPESTYVAGGSGLPVQALSRKLRGLHKTFEPHQVVCFFEIPSHNKAYAVALNEHLTEKALVAQVEHAARQDGVTVYTTFLDSYKRPPSSARNSSVVPV